MTEKVTKEKINELIIKARIETIENQKMYHYNITSNPNNPEPQQSKAFLELVDAVMEYLK